jgi:hypothetical protein
MQEVCGALPHVQGGCAPLVGYGDDSRPQSFETTLKDISLTHLQQTGYRLWSYYVPYIYSTVG